MTTAPALDPSPEAPLDARDVQLAESAERAAWRDLFAAAPREIADALGLATTEVDGATLLLAPRLPLTLFNRVLGLGLEHLPGRETLAAIDSQYRGAAVSRFWAHTTPLPAGRRTAERLAAWGFAHPPRGRWAKMIRSVEPVAATASDLIVRPTRTAERGALAGIVAAAHGMPAMMAPWIEALAARERWTMFGVWDREAPVGAGLVFLDGPIAWLGLAGTLPTHRRRGAQGLLMGARIAYAAAHGASTVATETGEPIAGEHNPSLANMLRAGFRKAYSRANHERTLEPDA